MNDVVFYINIFFVYLMLNFPVLLMYYNKDNFNNSSIGYKSKLAMKNKKNWLFANDRFSKLFIILNTIGLVFTMVFKFFLSNTISNVIHLTAYIFLLLVSLLATILYVELALFQFNKRNENNP